LGSFAHGRADDIRRQARELQKRLEAAKISLRVLPGAAVRVEPGMTEKLVRGDVLTLGDLRRHVLLELPYDRYLPLEPILSELFQLNLVGILASPEQNYGILRRPAVLASLVEAGCLLQIAAGSLCGSIHPECQSLAERLVKEGLVHFVASGPRLRRPQLRRAYERVAALADQETADDLCCNNPARVAEGKEVLPGRRVTTSARTSEWTGRSAA
jgi:protein-tyrosine phosphatase